MGGLGLKAGDKEVTGICNKSMTRWTWTAGSKPDKGRVGGWWGQYDVTLCPRPIGWIPGTRTEDSLPCPGALSRDW